MANYNSKANVPVAVKTRSQMDLSHITIASQDFGTLTPISCQYMVPGDEFHINVSEFTRLLPMVNPTFAKVDSIVRAFVVPISYLWSHFNDFITGSPTMGLVNNNPFSVSVVPSVHLYNLKSAFVQTAGIAEANLLATEVQAGSTDFDFTNRIGGVDTHYKLTLRGRKVYKWLQALGYNFPLDSIDGDDEQIAYGQNVSILPILAFYKFYLDWVVPSRFFDQFNSLRSILEGVWLQNTSLDNALSVNKLINFVPDSFLDNDYFTSAWKYPANVDDGSFRTFAVPDIVSDGQLPASHVSMTPNQGAFSDSVEHGYITSLSLQSIGALQSMLNRGMITGNKIKDWLKTEFGIEPSKDALRTSTYLGMFRNTVNISDVFATADTSAQGGTPLGAYSGRGGTAGNGKFDYKADQHSILIISAEIIPKPLYYQGLRPLNTMLNRFDFFQPEFDNVGVRAISRSELYMDTNPLDQDFTSDPDYLNGIFGFAPQYANLKTGYDNIVGDFRLKRFENSLSSWFLARKFVRPQQLANMDNINTQFCKVNGTTQVSYDDMFTYQGNDIDHFYSLFAIDIKANRPMVSLSDALTLPDQVNSRKTSVSVNNNPNV